MGPNLDLVELGAPVTFLLFIVNESPLAFTGDEFRPVAAVFAFRLC